VGNTGVSTAGLAERIKPGRVCDHTGRTTESWVPRRALSLTILVKGSTFIALKKLSAEFLKAWSLQANTNYYNCSERINCLNVSVFILYRESCFPFSFTNCLQTGYQRLRIPFSRNSLQGPEYLELVLKRSFSSGHLFPPWSSC
jgi:hypothetical protein